jgi:hypothetical protein
MPKLIINSEYPELIRFIFSNLRYEMTFPRRDNFMLIKNLSHNENRALETMNNYVIVSKNYATETWGRDEIVDYCKTQLKSRRKPTFETMSDKEFEKNVKVFWVTGKWMTEDIESGMFNLYKNLDSKHARWVEYFSMLDKGVHPMQIFYSLLTFATKVLDMKGDISGIKKGYAAVLLSKKRRVEENFKPAIATYSKYGREIEPEFKVLRFIMDLGGGYRETI